jgi:ribosome biogenesis GTPase
MSGRRSTPRRAPGLSGPDALVSTTGTVVESYGRRVVIRPAEREGPRLSCKIRGRRLEVVAGDDVQLEQTAGLEQEWVVTERLPRRNVLQRTDSRGADESIAANLDQLGIVVAPRPVCDPFIVDRYMAGAGYAGIDVLLILNKVDLLDEDGAAASLDWIDAYRCIGVPVVEVSAKAGSGLAGLVEQLSGRRTLLAGQSGVGKSSLTNALGAGALRATSALSAGSGEGRHTTVASAIVELPWGELADSPGVRDYAPPVVPLKSVQFGFREILAQASNCRFLDCLHLREPQCAVQAAAEAGTIDARRLESYRRLVNLTRQLDEKRGWRS